MQQNDHRLRRRVCCARRHPLVDRREDKLMSCACCPGLPTLPNNQRATSLEQFVGRARTWAVSEVWPIKSPGK